MCAWLGLTSLPRYVLNELEVLLFWYNFNVVLAVVAVENSRFLFTVNLLLHVYGSTHTLIVRQECWRNTHWTCLVCVAGFCPALRLNSPPTGSFLTAGTRTRSGRVSVTCWSNTTCSAGTYSHQVSPRVCTECTWFIGAGPIACPHLAVCSRFDEGW